MVSAPQTAGVKFPRKQRKIDVEITKYWGTTNHSKLAEEEVKEATEQPNDEIESIQDKLEEKQKLIRTKSALIDRQKKLMNEIKEAAKKLEEKKSVMPKLHKQSSAPFISYLRFDNIQEEELIEYPNVKTLQQVV